MNQREIKFRAWDKKKNQMCWVGKLETLREDIYDIETIEVYDWNGERDWYEIDAPEFILMQFTGLKDKNGKEIYEGDILMIEKYSDKPQVIEWGEQFFESFYGMTGWKIKDSINYGFDSIEAKKSEVIGNIFESPELLK